MKCYKNALIAVAVITSVNTIVVHNATAPPVLLLPSALSFIIIQKINIKELMYTLEAECYIE